MNELTHYGKLGMKWGHRTVPPSSDHSDTRSLLKKKRKELTTKELKAIAERLRLETEVAKLSQSSSSKVVNKGREVANKILSSYGSQTVTALTTFAAAYTAKKIIAYASKNVPGLAA
jgi:hypothetical protein